MGFKKPFRAEPVVLGEYQIARRKAGNRSAATKLLAIAACGGIAVGAASAGFERYDISQALGQARNVAANAGVVRRNDPLPGAHYSGCDEARAAGVAPLYNGEPGYRPEMDGDGDGIACEPHRASQNW